MAKKKVYNFRDSSYKTLQCSNCTEDVHRVAHDAVAVLCWKCSMKQIKNYETVIRDTNTKEF